MKKLKLEKGMVLSGRYEIIEQIGSGGMAIVYRAKDRKLDRDVTFKVLREEYNLDENFLSRFNVEARSAASLSHPNIVNVYDVGSENHINFIVMEYIDGVTLKELILKRAPFENEETLGVAIQIASALSHAHKNGIVHRDIKPQNILVTKTGVVKVTDFGIARGASSKTTTTTSNTMGSVHYFSPEQARGKYVDFRSDIYSLGISMYEMSTGKLPYNGDSAVSIALKHLNEPLPDILEENPEVSQSLEKIILKAASKSTAQRYGSADEMLIDLKRAITNESGDFISYSGGGMDSPTIILKDGEIEEIRGKSHDYRRQDDYDDYEDDYDDYDDYDDDKMDKRTERKVIIAAICTAVAIIALISAIGLNIFNKGKPKPVTMPDLKGYSAADAKEMLKDKGIENIAEEFEPSTTVEAGLIISQVPEANKDIGSLDTVKIVISSGEDTVTVPSLINMSVDDVYKMPEVTEGKIKIKQSEWQYHTEIEAAHIIDQFPEKGAEVAMGSEVTVIVSKGESSAEEVLVPNVKGKSESAATNELTRGNLNTGAKTFEYSDDYKEGLVMSQSIAGGEKVAGGTSIDLVISKGEKPVNQNEDLPKQPDVQGTTPTEKPVEQGNSRPVKSYRLKVDKAPPQAEEEDVQIKVEQINSDGSKTTVMAEKTMTKSDFPFYVDLLIKEDVSINVLVNSYPYMTYKIEYDKQ